MYGRRRDANERQIIDALRAVGATVCQLDGNGLPDLLVGYRGRTLLLEVKQEHGKAKVGGKKTADGLLPSQRAWHAAWCGQVPVIVTTPKEALVAISAVRHWSEDLGQ